MSFDQIQIRILKRLPTGQLPGDVLSVATRKGLPVDRFWRRRLKDAETDGCCEIVADEASATWTLDESTSVVIEEG